MLQEEIPNDANKFLQTAMSCGRQIVVTEVGKEIIKTQDFNINSKSTLISNSAPTSTPIQFTQMTALPRKNGDLKRKTVGIVMANSSPKLLATKPKLTTEVINKLCSEGKIIRAVGGSNVVTNGTLRLSKYRIPSNILNVRPHHLTVFLLNFFHSNISSQNL